MGWLANMIFGTPSSGQEGGGEVLPKAVENWQTAGGKTVATSSPEPIENETQADNQAGSMRADPLHDAHGLAIIPEVEIEHVEPHLSHDMHHLELWVRFKNHSEVEVEVTRAQCLRQHVDLGRFLKPGEAHEVQIYRGDTPRNNAEHTCEVLYKVIQTGDYFRANHVIRYKYERENDQEFYIPEEMELMGPIHKL